ESSDTSKHLVSGPLQARPMSPNSRGKSLVRAAFSPHLRLQGARRFYLLQSWIDMAWARITLSLQGEAAGRGGENAANAGGMEARALRQFGQRVALAFPDQQVAMGRRANAYHFMPQLVRDDKLAGTPLLPIGVVHSAAQRSLHGDGRAMLPQTIDESVARGLD